MRKRTPGDHAEALWNLAVTILPLGIVGGDVDRAVVAKNYGRDYPPYHRLMGKKQNKKGRTKIEQVPRGV